MPTAAPFRRPCRYFYVLIFVASFTCVHATLSGQVLLDVDFDQRANASQRTYSESQIESDFGPLRFTNGVNEGRVSLVSGSEAFGGSGASIKVEFPVGSFGTSTSGAQWLAEYDTDIEEAWLTYRVKFGPGFDFVRGGKLPGLAGGSAPSGSAPADGVRGWAARLMWRTHFEGQTGQPRQTTSQAISYAKHVHSGFDRDGRQEDEEFWFELDGSSTTLRSDVWYAIRQRVRLNTPGQRDGILQIWLDGRLVLDQDNIQFRNTPDLKIDRFFFSTFFGGGFDWRASKNEVIYFDDFRVTVPQERRVPEQYPSPAAAVAAANPGDTILLGSANWYANLYIDKPLTLRGRGNARLMAADGSRPVVEADSDGVSVESMEIARGVRGVEAFAKATRLNIQNCTFVDNFGDAIRIRGTRDISIQNCDVVSNEGRGIFLDQVEGFYVANCLSSDNGGAGFEIFSNSGFVTNCQAINNQAGAGFFFIGSNSGFQNNSSIRNRGMGYLMVNGRSNGFTGNSADQNSSFGLLAYGIDDSFFAGNLIERSGGVGVILDNSNRNAFMNNTLSFNSGIGAYFSPSTDGNYSTGNQYQQNAFSLGLIDEGSNFVE